ncbi:MAG: endonuclease/exonuclease/phosphatase family protein [Deltaproteobacteria bacterium]|nr:endonuclease/exonuclease/phosphatase family protein [Deltaproteobacteria bacterium]
MARVFGLCVAAGLFAACGGDEAAYDGPRVPLKVMTRNLYLGADITDVVLSPSVEQVPARAAAFWAEVVRSDFPARAKLLADEIMATSPDVIGLQEVEIFRQQVPSDFAAAPGVNATVVAYDFLALLLEEVAARGQPYNVVLENTLSDVELPTALPDGGLMDLRMTDRDVMLAKPGVVTAPLAKAAFTNFLAVNVGGAAGPRVEVKRGYATANVTMPSAVGAATFIWGNAHLEVGGPLKAFQEPQADELVRLMKPISGPMIFTGDFNSPATGLGTRSYGFLRRIFADSYQQLNLAEPGFSCCMDIYAPGLAGVDERIDLVLTRDDITATAATVVGGIERTASGISASDHRGVVLTLGLVPDAAR